MKKFWPILIILAAIIIFFQQIIINAKIFISPALGLSDYTLATIPWTDYLSSTLKTGRIPLWSWQMHAGFPFAQNGESGLFYPLNLLLNLIFPLSTALNLYIIITFAIMALATYYFVRHLGLSKNAGLISSLSFTFAGGIVARLVHIQIIAIVAYLPLALLLLDKFLDSHKPFFLIFTSLILSFQILIYHPQTTMVCFLTFICYFIFRTFWAKKIPPREKIFRFLSLTIIFLLTFLLSAIQLIPSIEYFSLSERSRGLTNNNWRLTNFPWHPEELVYFLKPAPFGDPSLGTYQPPAFDYGYFWENNCNVGLVGLILALLALFFLFKSKREVRFFGFLFMLFTLLALGQYTPLGLMLKLPPLSFFRIPSRFLIIPMFSLTILAGYGFDGLTQRLSSKKKIMLGVFVCVFILFDLFSFGFNYNGTYDAQKWFVPPKTAQFLARDKSFYRVHSIADVTMNQGWREDIEPYYHDREGMYLYLTSLYGFNQPEGGPGLLPARFAQWYDLLRGNIKVEAPINEIYVLPKATKLLRLKTTKYIISPLKINNPDYIFKLAVNYSPQEPTFNIYEIIDPLPHVFLVDKIKSINSSSILAEITNDSFNPRQTALVEEPIGKTDNLSSQGKVDIIEYQPEKVIITAQTTSPAFLVLTDNNFPGWQAKIDGQPTKIYQTDYLFRGVKIPAGQHQIEFVFRPISFYLGAGISIITLIVLALFVFFKYVIKLPIKSFTLNPLR